MYSENESLSTDVEAIDAGTEVRKQVLTPVWLRSLGAKAQQRTASLVSSIVRLPGKTKIFHLSAQRAHHTIPLVGVIMGTIAFGFWWKSIAAGLFACSGLFLLAGIYKAVERIGGPVQRWEPESTADGERFSDVPARDSSHKDIDTLAAIERLKSWVANETSPTEEDVKSSCTVLLELLPPKYTR